MIEEIEKLRKELRKSPKDALRLKILGHHYLQHGYYKEAQDQYHLAAVFNPRLASEIILDHERILDSDPHNISTHMSLASFYMFLGETESAILEFEETLEADPKNVEVYNTLGSIYIKQDRIDEGISLLEKALEKEIDDILLIERLAGAYLEKEKLPEAIALYERVLHSDPNSKKVLRILGDLYTQVGKLDLAAERLGAMFEDDPEVSREVCSKLEDLLKKDERNVRIREVLADIYTKCLKPDMAVELLNKVLELDRNKLDSVIDKYRSMLRTYPKHAEISQALAEALILKGEFSEAVETYNHLIKQDNNFIEQAIAGYEKILESYPQQVLAHQFLGEAYLAKGKVEEAVLEFRTTLLANPETIDYISKKCREILRIYPQNLSSHILLGEIYLLKEDARRAIEEAEQILGMNSTFAPAHILLGEGYAKLKLSRKAKEAYRQAITLDSYNIFAHQKYKEIKEMEADKEIEALKRRIAEDPWRLSLHLDLAKLFLIKGKQKEALAELQIAAKDRSRAAFAYNFLGLIFKSEGRMDLALTQFQKAIEHIPPELSEFSKIIRFNLGLVYEAEGQIRKALRIFESILQEDLHFKDVQAKIKYLKAASPQSSRYKILLMVRRDFGKPETIGIWGREAREKAKERKSEEIEVSFGQSRLNYGFEYFIKGMQGNAEEEFRLAAGLDVNFAPALNNLGATLLHEGKLEEAESQLGKAVLRDPQNAIYYNNLGLAHYLRGNLKSAQEEFEKAASLDAELSAPILNLGDLHYTLGRGKEALDCYQKIIETDVLADLAERRLQFKIPSKL